MTRFKISAALMLAATVGAFAAMPAQAGSRPAHKPAMAAYAQSSSVPAPSAQKGDWENRSVIYRGPTYIGRY